MLFLINSFKMYPTGHGLIEVTYIFHVPPCVTFSLMWNTMWNIPNFKTDRDLSLLGLRWKKFGSREETLPWCSAKSVPGKQLIHIYSSKTYQIDGTFIPCSSGLLHKKRKIDVNFTLNPDFCFLSCRWVRPDLSDVGGQTFLMFEIPTGKVFVEHYNRCYEEEPWFFTW